MGRTEAVAGLTETGSAVVIRLPLPRDLLPNKRSGAHWGGYARLAKDWRLLARIKAHEQLRYTLTPSDIWMWPAARLDIQWHCAGTPPDDDNIIAACKPLRDGIADTGIVANDRCITTGEVQVVKARRVDEGLVLALTRLEQS